MSTRKTLIIINKLKVSTDELCETKVKHKSAR